MSAPFCRQHVGVDRVFNIDKIVCAIFVHQFRPASIVAAGDKFVVANAFSDSLSVIDAGTGAVEAIVERRGKGAKGGETAPPGAIPLPAQ